MIRCLLDPWKSQNLAKLYDYKEIAKRTQKALETASSNPIAELDEEDPNKLTFDRETGEIKSMSFDLSKRFLEKMKITNFALYFPSEALENENKGREPELHYFQKMNKWLKHLKTFPLGFLLQ